MCRNIRPLFNFAPPASPEEIHAAALQYVRKVSGMRAPTAKNARAFERAIEVIAHATHHLIDALETKAPHKSREVEAERARRRNARRFA
jgi:hypothetical protein